MKISQDSSDGPIDLLPLGNSVIKYCILFVKENQKSGLSGDDEDILQKVKLLGMHMILNIKFDNDEVISILEMIKDTCEIKCKNDDIDEPGLIRYCSRLVQTLEAEYPSAYDNFIYKYTTDGNLSLSSLQKKILTLEIAKDKSHSDVFLKLNDSKALMRAETLKFLAAHANPNELRQSIKNTIEELWKDEEPCVIDALLLLPESLWCLNAERFVGTLVLTYQHYIVSPKKWNHTVLYMLSTFLDSDICAQLEGKNRSQIILALLPYMFCNQDFLKVILKSQLANKDALMKKIKTACNKKQDVSTVWQNITSDAKSALPSTQDIIHIMSHEACFKKSVYTAVCCVLLGANVTPQDDPQQLLDVFRFLSKFFDDKDVQGKFIENFNHESFVQCLRLTEKGRLSLALFSYFVNTMISRLDVSSLADKSLWVYCSTSPLSKFLGETFCTLVNKCNEFEKNGQKAHLQTYVQILKYFIQHFISDPKQQIQFYCNLSLNSNADFNLSIWCLYMLTKLAEKQQISMQPSFLPFFLILLFSPNETVRKLTLDILQTFGNTFAGAVGKNTSTSNFIRDILKYREEIYLDHQTVVQYVGMILDLKDNANVLSSILATVTDKDIPSHAIMQLLEILSNVHSCHIFSQLIPLASKILDRDSAEIIPEPESKILFYILKRFSQDASSILDDTTCWKFVQKCVANFKSKLELNGKETLCANIIFSSTNAEIFEDLTLTGKERLLQLMLDIKHDSENDDILMCIKDFVKKISLDCKLIEPFLKNMVEANVKQETSIRSIRKVIELPTVELLKTREWKLGIATLESIEHKKKLDNTKVVLPYIFKVLKKCLQFDEQIHVEYAKQLCLTSIYNCYQKIEDVSSIPANLFDIEAVVESIRTSKNPQTHHQALILLSFIATVLPEQVLKKFMPIFTFMGNSILRLDDAYSLQIINKVIESVVPVILHAKRNKNNPDFLETNVISILRIFTDAIMDIPDHRRIYLMEKLLNTLENGRYVYIFLELMFERHVLLPPEDAIDVNTIKRYKEDLKSQNSGGIPKRLKLALHVCSKYPLSVLIDSCHKLLQFLQLMPHDKDDQFVNEAARKKVLQVIKVDKITPKQFRHYKYTLLMFTSSLLSSHNLVALMSKNNDYEEDDPSKENLDDLFKNTIEEILKYLQAVTKMADQNTQHSKYWAGMLSQCYDILDKINALIDSGVFVSVIRKLLKHKTLSLRKRCLDMLNWRLQQKHHFESEDLLKLLKPLVNIAINEEGHENLEAQFNQQTALISLKLFVRYIGEEHSDKFSEILDRLMIVFKKQHEPPVMASLILCIAEMCSVLKAHTLNVLPTFMPKLLNILNQQKSCDVITLGIVSSLLKVVDNLSMFMSPYLLDILYETCSLSTLLETSSSTDNTKGAAIKTKLGYLKSKLSLDIPGRVLMSSIASCFKRIISSEDFKLTPALMSILGESFSAPDFIYNNEVTEFFLSALHFRIGVNKNEDDVTIVENSVVGAFVKLTLKLSESNFKPLFNKLYDWAFRNGNVNYRDRIITFFVLTSQIAGALKSLFVVFAGSLVKDCSTILDKTQLGKHEDLYLPEEHKNAVLLEAVLQTLLSIFTHDVHQFMNKERFNLLMQHLVDQLENKLSNYEDRCRSLVQPCIVQFAASSNDDVQWKNLNYQILLKTRDNDSYVRLVSLECILLLASKLGDNFLPLLPETVPFLAELLEDENEHVEKACHKVVQEMEQLLGEPISKYF